VNPLAAEGPGRVMCSDVVHATPLDPATPSLVVADDVAVAAHANEDIFSDVYMVGGYTVIRSSIHVFMKQSQVLQIQ